MKQNKNYLVLLLTMNKREIMKVMHYLLYSKPLSPYIEHC